MVKINESVKRAGFTVEFVKGEKDALQKALAQPALIIIDLNFGAADPLSLIAKLKSNAETKTINLLGYVSHVQADLKRNAQEAGCDMVLARSAFSQNLPQILNRYARA